MDLHNIIVSSIREEGSLDLTSVCEVDVKARRRMSRRLDMSRVGTSRLFVTQHSVRPSAATATVETLECRESWVGRDHAWHDTVIDTADCRCLLQFILQ